MNGDIELATVFGDSGSVMKGKFAGNRVYRNLGLSSDKSFFFLIKNSQSLPYSNYHENFQPHHSLENYKLIRSSQSSVDRCRYTL
ncbi:predicted protein [Sclerotinia sclerotiorum 1980 UF-70]|uniref:Uncharacterized protein n=1 Tax=Sclerotinia sclerotiorum (strain ATCC 18683 / 1980 / Ss-1) TaxID=665079 RepID=A7EME7_SCLS1|nr:predicted protein [Sclerotinia sclerotiorum 1980 UF-70]EDO04013.1 predicted protein [Sclerotinia sclerotiorum 1980 UF-70]